MFQKLPGTKLLSSFGESWTEMRLSLAQSRDSLQELWCLGEAQSKAGLRGRHVPRSSVFIIEGFRGLKEEGESGAGSVEGFVFSLKQSFDENERRGCVFYLGTGTGMNNKFPIAKVFFSCCKCLSLLFLLAVSQQARAGLWVQRSTWWFTGAFSCSLHSAVHKHKLLHSSYF